MANDVDTIAYVPTPTFTNVNSLYGNHFKFTLLNWPDVTFDTQSITIPSVTAAMQQYPNPFVTLPQVGDHLHYGTFDVVYLMDKAFNTYFSLYYWIKGYGFPHSYDEIAAFRAAQAARTPNPRPQVRELEKTRALLSILQADTNSTVAEIQYEDVFPIAIGEVTFETTQSDAPLLTGRVTFATSDFHVVLKS